LIAQPVWLCPRAQNSFQLLGTVIAIVDPAGKADGVPKGHLNRESNRPNTSWRQIRPWEASTCAFKRHVWYVLTCHDCPAGPALCLGPCFDFAHWAARTSPVHTGHPGREVRATAVRRACAIYVQHCGLEHGFLHASVRIAVRPLPPSPSAPCVGVTAAH